MCLSPIRVKVPFGSGYRYIDTPCRNCLECLREKQNESTVRIVSELQNCKGKACFLTLTYSDENVPFFVDESSGETRKSLRISDVQDWLKRFRSKLDYYNSGKIRVSYCGEYGSRTFRPHYHCIVYGKLVDEIKPALIDWQNRFGFVQAKNVNFFEQGSTSAVGRYLAKYASKGVFSKDMPIFFGELGKKIERPFFRNSRYLGLDFLLKRLDYFLQPNIRKYDTFGEYLYGVFPYQKFNLGKYAVKLPSSWCNLVFFRKFNKKIAPYGKYIIDTICSSVKEFENRLPLGTDFTNALEFVRYRLFIKKCRAEGCTQSEEYLYTVYYGSRQCLEKEYEQKLASSSDFASKLCGFYSRSFC